jgi:hypothetical protein
LAKEPLACQIIGNYPNKDQSFGHDQNIGRASFGLNPNKPLAPSLYFSATNLQQHPKYTIQQKKQHNTLPNLSKTIPLFS